MTRQAKAKHKKAKHKKAKNMRKLYALAAVSAGLLGVVVLHDATALVASLFFTVALFTGRHIYW